MNNKKRERKATSGTDVPKFTGRLLYGNENRDRITEALNERGIVDNSARLAAWPGELSTQFNNLDPQEQETWNRRADEINNTGGSEEDKQE